MRLLWCLLLLSLPGCRRIEFVEVPRTVVIPCPEPPPVSMPDLPIYHLEADATPDQVAKAYAASIVILKGHLLQAHALLNGYRIPK